MSKYAEFFATVERSRKVHRGHKGKRPGKRRPYVQIIKPELLAEFCHTLAQDGRMPLEEKALFSALVGSGGRISEILELKKKDFRTIEEYPGDLFFTITISKQKDSHARKNAERRKRGEPEIEWVPQYRTCKVPDKLVDFVNTLLTQRRPHERVWPMSRHTALRRCKRYLGNKRLETHSFRHTYFSWLLTEHQLKTLEIADVMRVDESTVSKYTHIADKVKFVKGLGL
jgi:integrase